eukprot:214912-Prymnesium_polylepis.1
MGMRGGGGAAGWPSRPRAQSARTPQQPPRSRPRSVRRRVGMSICAGRLHALCRSMRRSGAAAVRLKAAPKAE